MRIAVFPNAARDTGFAHTRRLISLISAHKGEALLLSSMKPLFDLPSVCYVDTLQSADLLICLGGDGTFLSTVRLTGWAPLPTIGVNLGSVGFLPQISPDSLDYAVEQLFCGEFSVEKRMMISVCHRGTDHGQKHQHTILNDVVLGRGISGRIVTVMLTINEEDVERIPGDGLIVSTPTGSTAYALSAGGPIVHPQMSLFLITPLCPHSLHNRSYLTSDRSRIRLTLLPHTEPAMVSIDGQENYPLTEGEYLDITRASDMFELIRLGDDRFYKTLSAKIQQRGTGR